MLDIKKLLTKILSTLVVHTSGNWKYIRIGGGLTVAFGKVSVSVANTISSSAYGGYRSADTTVSIPSGIFGTKPTYVYAMKNTANSLRLMNFNGQSATSLSFYTGSAESTTQTITISILCIGGVLHNLFTVNHRKVVAVC